MDYGIPSNAIHVFPSRVIGKHEWCIVIVPSIFKSTMGTDISLNYYWRRAGVRSTCMANEWQAEKNWPSYNHNDGCFAGLPRTLVAYWSEHRDEIQHWIEHGRAPSAAALTAQLPLFAEA